MTHIDETLQRLGGIVTLAALRREGVTEHERRDALASGSLLRLRNGWFASPRADGEQVRAVRLGGRLTGASLLRAHGLWIMPDRRLHVALPAHSTRLRSPDDRSRAWSPLEHPDVCLHWTEFPWDPPRSSPVNSVFSAMAHLIQCSDHDSVIVTIDSALNSRMLALDDLANILAELPDKHSGLLDDVDSSSQSGLETLSRLRLRRRRLRVRTQVFIDGVGRVDVLIGDRLILELDSRAHHLGDGYEQDRARDLELFRLGFTVIRVSYRRVMYDWPSVEAAIIEAVRRGEHLRRAIHRRLGLALTDDTHTETPVGGWR